MTTTPARAGEIAKLKSFGLAEFIELTGIGLGSYGIYTIERSGVSIPRTNIDAELEPAAQVELLRAEVKLSLAFPCTPQDFVTWHDHTKGTNGVSEFPLASGFMKAFLGQESDTTSAVHGPPTKSSTIVATFQVLPDQNSNRSWWDVRMRKAKIYGLDSARASIGRAKQESTWFPGLVAAWLVEKKHLTSAQVTRALSAAFPDLDTSWL